MASKPESLPPGAAASKLEIVQLPVGLLDPAPWNVNRVAPDMMHRLREYLRKEGLVQPLIVRPLGERYQLVGGHHRLQILRDDFGWKEVPCVVLAISERRAKIMSVALNEMGGDPVPRLMADLVHDLSRDTTLEDLSTLLPYSTAELQDFEALLKLPDGLAAFIDEEVARERKEAPAVLTFVVDDAALVERAIETATEGMEGKNRKGRALVLIARAYLDAKGLSVDAAQEGAAQ